MSYYYNYYIGYQKDGKIYPWGPYTRDGKLQPALERSQSFASNLYNYFSYLDKSEASDELIKEFDWAFKNSDSNYIHNIKYITLDKLPTGSTIRRGYFLISDVEAYEAMLADGDVDYYFDGFYDMMSPVTYAARIVSDINNGYKYDPYDEESRHPATDYMYYAYEDITSAAYEANYLSKVCNALTEYGVLPDGATPIIFEAEG